MGTLDGNGIYRFDEKDPASTFSDLLNRGQDATSGAIGALKTSTTARLSALDAAIATTAASGVLTPEQGRITTSSLTIERKGDTLIFSNYFQMAVTISIAVGSTYTVGVVSPAPRAQFLGLVSTIKGPCELLITTAGVVSLRNWGQVPLAFAPTNHVALSGVFYRISGT